MSEIAFYHCTATKVERALAGLLEKTLKAGKRALVVIPDKARLFFFDDYLWTYQEDKFLPHGSSRDGFASDQPIWLSQEDYPANNAVYAIMLEGAIPKSPQNYERIIHLFDGTLEHEVEQAREAWKDYKAKEFDLVYYRQGEDASWRKNT